VSARTPLILHENVVGFQPDVLLKELGSDYQHIVVGNNVRPLQVGYGGVSRPRRYDLFYHTARVTLLEDPGKLYEKLACSLHGWVGPEAALLVDDTASMRNELRRYHGTQSLIAQALQETGADAEEAKATARLVSFSFISVYTVSHIYIYICMLI
jgi:hypothetical protein